MKRKHLNKHLRVQVFARDGYRCLMCGRTANQVELQIDHVISVAEGGTDELENLATLCRDCNAGKSAYRFTDYRTMPVVSPHLGTHFRFLHDPRTGDFERYHLYLYFKDGIRPGSPDGNYHHTWTISGTKYDTSTDKCALEQRRRSEEEAKFLVEIRRQLVAAGKRLVENEEGVCRVNG
jgi:hypothetical protein